MKISKIAMIEIKLDEEAYAQEVGKMWDDYEERGAAKPNMEPGWGVLSDAVQKISFSLSCEHNLYWDLDTYSSHLITLSGGTVAEYRRYESELIARLRLSQYSRWAKVVR